MKGNQHQKIGGRDFLVFADGLVPVDQIKLVRPAGDKVVVSLLNDGFPERYFVPLAPPEPRPAAGK